MFRYAYLHVWSPSLLVVVYRFTYMPTEFASGIFVCVYILHICTLRLRVCVYVYIYAHRDYVCVYIFTYMYTEITCGYI